MFYRLSGLKRYNNQPRIKSESLAEHQYYCALIVMFLKPHIVITETQYALLLEYALIHDVGELYTGDMPHNIKKDFPILKETLDIAEQKFLRQHGFDTIENEIQNTIKLKTLFKLADTIQVIQYCKNEFILGNHSKEMEQIDDIAHDEFEKYFRLLVTHGVMSDDFDLTSFMLKL